MIVDMQIEDLPEILMLEKQLFPSDPWEEENYLYELLENPFAHCIVYKIGGKPVGYADYWITYETGQISNIAVDSAYQRQGIGHALVSYIKQKCIQAGCDNISLEVRQSNEKAIRLYTEFGFMKVAKRIGYYQDGEDADLMVCPLGG